MGEERLGRRLTELVFVGSRDCTTLVDGVLKQLDVVRRVGGDDVPLLTP